MEKKEYPCHVTVSYQDMAKTFNVVSEFPAETLERIGSLLTPEKYTVKVLYGLRKGYGWGINAATLFSKLAHCKFYRYKTVYTQAESFTPIAEFDLPIGYYYSVEYNVTFLCVKDKYLPHLREALLDKAFLRYSKTGRPYLFGHYAAYYYKDGIYEIYKVQEITHKYTEKILV